MQIDFAKYIDAGYRIFPVKGKFPHFPSLPFDKDNKPTWLPFTERFPTDSEIESWEKKKGFTGVAILLGKDSGIIGLDYDCFNDYPDILRLIPESPVIRVGKSPKWMRIYKYNSKLPSQKIKLRKVGEVQDGIELLTDGRYFVAEGIHPDTQKPYFYVGEHILNVNKEFLPTFPLDNWQKICALAEKYTENGYKELNQANEPAGRHDKLLQLCGKLLSANVSDAEIIESLNKADDSFTESYFETHKNTAEKMLASVKKTHKRNLNKEKEKFKIVENESGQQTLNTFYSIQKNGRPLPEYKLLAEHLIEKYHAVSDDMATYLYRDTHYEALSPSELESIVYSKTLGLGQPSHISGFVRFIKSASYKKDYFDFCNLGFLNLSNGFLDVKKKEIVPHDPAHRQVATLPIEFDLNAKCPLWEKFLNEIFLDNEDLIEIVREMFGYILLGGEPFLHKAFVLCGTGRNGKSTLIKIMKRLIGDKNFSAVSMRELGKPFSNVMLKNKIVNLVDESPKDTINAEEFKKAVGGGDLIAAKKGQDEFILKCQARFVFAANGTPKFEDSSTGLYERLVLIPFDLYIPNEKRDPDIEEKLSTELSGILNWALVGAERLMVFKRLTTVGAIEESHEEYKIETDSVYAFFKEKIELSDYFTGRKELYEAYKNWAEIEGITYPVSKKTLTRRVRQYAKEKATLENRKIDKDFLSEVKRIGAKAIANIAIKQSDRL